MINMDKYRVLTQQERLLLQEAMTNMDKHRETFREEAYELLAELETALLELEESPDNAEIIGRVFRAMHTIKGSGAMFGFDDISGFTHEIETVYDMVRNGEIAVTKALINLTLAGRDHIREMLDACNGGSPVNKEKTREITASFKQYTADINEKEALRKDAKPFAPINAGKCSEEQPQNAITYRISFCPPQEVFMNGTNPLCLLAELRSLGDCRITSYTDKIPLLEDIDPEHCYMRWDILLTTTTGIDAIKDVFIFVGDDCGLDIRIINNKETQNNDANIAYKRLGEILVERGEVTHDDIKNALLSQKRLGEILVDSGVVSPIQIQAALTEQQQQAIASSKKRSGGETASSIRVPASKLDNFVDLVGELVTIQQRLSQTATGLHNPELLSIAEEVERLTIGLRDSAFSVRMLPIGTLFSKFKRLVHDLSNELGRDVELTSEGGETELDKTVIEKMNDPLVHLIRNSIDHGIEPPDVRKAAGKPERGTICLSAVHSGSNVLIHIKDDGKGLDTKAIRSKAVKNGLITADTKPSEKELFSLIFLPGFSTAQNVTSVSGRGVGMDVVKRTVDELNGSIDINSEYGCGTTITVKLPLTLAIIEGLQVEVGGEQFVLPLSMVEECVELGRTDAKKDGGWQITDVRGGIVPYIRLKEWFMFGGVPQDTEQIVITNTDDRRVGFVVDRVIGERQTVVKSLGRVYRDVQGVSGATILGNGRVALIIDVPQIIQKAETFFS